MLPADLMSRIRARAANPKTRTDAPDLSGLGVQQIALKIGGTTLSMAMGIGAPDPNRAPAKAPTPLADPVSPERMAQAERRIGVTLPDELKQLYSGIADGGFGPGGGLAPLDEAVARYQELMGDPPGEGGQPWPAHLFPINLWDLGCDCYDLKSGEITYWDEEALANGPSDRVWRRSFQKSAESLGAYFEKWLATPARKDDRFVNAAELGLSEALGKIDIFVVRELRKSIEILRGKTAAERAVWGLPEEGWEEALCEMRGLDPKVYLELIKRPEARDPHA